MAYPLLIMQDGQWAVGPLQLPYIADALIKHRRMQPAVIAMMQSGNQDERNREYISNDKYYTFPAFGTDAVRADPLPHRLRTASPSAGWRSARSRRRTPRSRTRRSSRA